MELRSNQIEVRAEGERIQGTAVVFWDGNSGTQYEIQPGVFERIMPTAIDLRNAKDIVCCRDHNENDILGRTPDSLELFINQYGLHYSTTPDESTLYKDTIAQIRAKKIRGSSFAFVPTEKRWVRDGSFDVREITKLDLFHVSPVVRPAYNATKAFVRSEDFEMIKLELEKEKQNLETIYRILKSRTII